MSGRKRGKTWKNRAEVADVFLTSKMLINGNCALCVVVISHFGVQNGPNLGVHFPLADVCGCFFTLPHKHPQGLKPWETMVSGGGAEVADVFPTPYI